MRRVIALIACALAVTSGARGLRSQSALDIPIDAAASRRPIDARIYGVAFADAASMADLRIPVNRWGGNSTSRYNWQANGSNRASDWYFESIADGSAVAGDSADSFIAAAKSNGAEPLLTIPTIGWVAKFGPNRTKLPGFSIAKYGPQTGADFSYFPDAGNGVSAATGQPIAGNDPNDANIPATSVFQQGWVQHLVTRWGNSANGGLRYYVLDNEPSIWHSTHRDVHPTGAKMDEILNDAVAYATQIKAVDGGALIVGPEEWGWSGYFYSGYDQQWGGAHGWNSLPDRTAHGNADYLPWYLDQLRQHDTATGQRLLDIFSVHFYPQGGQYGNDTSTAMQQLRNRSTRALWDPSYVDESWIGTPVQLVPRLKNWAATSYPGTKVGITEYNWGAEGHINGATTQADILGIFGREGLDLATLWTTPAASSPTYKAIKLYRNYDGQGSGFGDVSVSAVAPNPDLVSVFAAQRSVGGTLTVMAVNKDVSTSSAVNFRLANFTAGGPVQVWQLTSSNAITRLADTAVSGSTLPATLPAQSITLFVLPTSSMQAPQPPTRLRILDVSTTGVATSVSATSGTPQSTAINSAFATALQATVRDGSSNPMSGVTVTFTAPGAGASAGFGGAATATAVTTATGIATAPALTANGQPGSYTVTASVAGVATPAAFALTNSSGTTGGGVWTNQAVPVAVNTCSGTGVGSVMVDPVRPSDYYALVCQDNNGATAVLKSVDFGQSWTNINRTPGSVMTGRPWGAAIDPNPNRNPNTPPTMYAPEGYGSLGLFKSTDGGVTWTQLFKGSSVFDPLSPFGLRPDVYSVSVLPDNPPNHILITFHGYWKNSSDAGFGESTDGGVTWTVHLAPGGIGQSHYLMIVDATTWLSVAQDNGGVNGIWKTSTGGRTLGIPSILAWRKVDTLEHVHGSFQGFVDSANGAIYAPGLHGIRRSADRGETWAWAYQTGDYISNLVSAGNYIYGNYLYGPELIRSSRSDGMSFAPYTTAPGGMVQGSGPMGSASSFNGTNWVIVSGNQTYGLWRYVQ